MHPTQPIENFDNVSTPFGILAICDISIKKFTEIVPGESLRRVRGKPKRGSQIYMDLSKAISRKQCKIGCKLVLITN